MKNFKEESFVEDFSTLPMSIISYSDDPDEQLQTLNSLILECIERHAPLKRIRVTRPPAPWMKCPYIKDLGERHCRYEAHNTPSDTNLDYFRSVLKAAIRTSRKAFIEKVLYSNKSSEVWKVIHRILKPSPKPLRFNPDTLNGHFASTAQRTLNVNATPYVELTELIENLSDDSDYHTLFNNCPVSREEVFKAIKTLRSDCSTGADQIPTTFVKLVADNLAGPLTRIINGCITEAYFPKLCKIARVSPIPKVDNPTTNDELRPISILPVLSKVFERLVGWQMSEFANSASLLHDNISSFRKGHSTTTALLGIRDDIKRAMKRKEVTLMVLADFSKAFDTVCFKTTLKKFYKLVFSKKYLKWLLSYSSDWTQFVQIDDTKSATPQIVTVWNTSYA